MSSGTPPALVSIAAPTIARASIRRYLSKSGSSTHEASGSPSCSGTAVPPVPTITLANRSGCAAAANRAAAVPTSGPDDVRRVQAGLGDHLRQELAHRPRREADPSRASDAPKPGRSTANRRACSASVAQIGANAYRLSGHGLVSRIVCSDGPSRLGEADPNAVNRLVLGLYGCDGWHAAHPRPSRSSLAPWNTRAKSRDLRWRSGSVRRASSSRGRPDTSPASHASRRPGRPRSQSGRVSLSTSRRSCQRS